MMGKYSASLTFLALLFNLLWATIEGSHHLFSISFAYSLIGCFMMAVSILMLSVLEGLSVGVAIILAYSVGIMREGNNLVRYLSVC